jgi:hypothetical protein
VGFSGATNYQKGANDNSYSILKDGISPVKNYVESLQENSECAELTSYVKNHEKQHPKTVEELFVQAPEIYVE